MAMTRIPLSYARDIASRVGRFRERAWFMFLDSCRDRCQGGRYDILVCDPMATVVTRGIMTTVTVGLEVRTSGADPFEVLQATLAECLPAVRDESFFSGGAIGYFAYDLGRRVERLPMHARRDLDMPEMAFGIYGWAIVVDHLEQSSALFIHPAARCDTALVLRLWEAQGPLTPAAYGSMFEVTSPAGPELSFEAYASAWHRIKRYLRDGDVYQVNLTRRFSAKVSGDPWDAYLRLRTINPAPYSAFLALPEGQILSSSPERFLGIRDRSVETKPIKGTRPRGSTPESDRELAEALARSAKDRAENVMIVDLLRNDLGKHSVIGSVSVPMLCAVESFATVHHLVSTVRSELGLGVSSLTLLRDCFPGGSITGAPKLRAMEIIEELEPQRRSIYCGAIGYVSAEGHMDTNIAIRTLLVHGGRMYCWAGGGIVMDSELEAEYAESLAKASAMLEVFARAELAHVGHQDRR